MKSTVRAVGEIIASSAGTVIVGLATMTAAELGLYNTSGPSIAIGVAIALLAGLTLTPAMLCILGDHAFWPRKARHMKEAGVWHAWAGKVVKRPVVALLVPVIVLVPLAIYGGGLARDFDLLGDLPKDSERPPRASTCWRPTWARAPCSRSTWWRSTRGFRHPQGPWHASRQLQAKLTGLTHVATVRSFTGSLARPKTLSVADQLGVQAKAVRAGARAARQQAACAGGAQGLRRRSSRLRPPGCLDVYGYLLQLAQSYPEVLQDPGYKKAAGALSELATLAQTSGLTTPGGGTTRAVRRTPAVRRPRTTRRSDRRSPNSASSPRASAPSSRPSPPGPRPSSFPIST